MRFFTVKYGIMRPIYFIKTKGIEIHIQFPNVRQCMGRISNTVHTDFGVPLMDERGDLFYGINGTQDIGCMGQCHQACFMGHQAGQVLQIKFQCVGV